MALTFDDLPYVAAGYPDTVRRGNRITAALLESLAAHDAPVTAFVNESKLHVDERTEARIRMLERWVDYGAILGNHTWSHPDLNDLTVAEFEKEIVEGEPVTSRLMASRAPYQRFFRHPYTHTGNTEEKKSQVAAFLRERGYEVAPVTIDSQDYVFNPVYLDAIESGDDAQAARVRDAYVDFAIAATVFAERISVEIFAEEIPQTLLLHANDINAASLVDLLDRLADRGYEFASLGDAMKHPAYRTPDNLVTDAGPSWLWRWAKSLDKEVDFRGDPEPPGWILAAAAR